MFRKPRRRAELAPRATSEHSKQFESTGAGATEAQKPARVPEKPAETQKSRETRRDPENPQRPRNPEKPAETQKPGGTRRDQQKLGETRRRPQKPADTPPPPRGSSRIFQDLPGSWRILEARSRADGYPDCPARLMQHPLRRPPVCGGPPAQLAAFPLAPAKDRALARDVARVPPPRHHRAGARAAGVLQQPRPGGGAPIAVA